MASMNKSQGPHPRIVVGLRGIQDQIRMVNRLSDREILPSTSRNSDMMPL